MSQPERPLDRRPRWGLYFFLAASLLLLLLVGGYFVWSVGSTNRLEKQVAAYKAAGEPIEPQDFLVIDVPDDQNAVFLLRKAANVDKTTSEWKAYEKLDADLPLREKEVAIIRAYVAQQEKTWADVDAAMQRKGIDWQIPFQQPVINVLLPHLNEMRELARGLHARAMLRYHEGDHAGALADVRRIMFIADALDKQAVLVSHLVSVGTRALAADAVMQMSPGLKIGSAPGDASREDVQRLIAALLDERSQRDGLRMAMHGERMMQLDTTRSVASGRVGLNAIGAPGAASPLATVAGVALKPMMNDDGLLMIRNTTAINQAAQAAANWPAYKASSPDEFAIRVREAPYRHLLASILLPSLDRAIQTDYRAMTERRASATMLAIRMYAIDHGGQRPRALEALVPKYLPAVPLDAMASGAPLKYVADPSRPILYSVGENGTDEGGSETAPRPGKNYSGRWQVADAVFHLNLPAREAEEPESESESSDAAPAKTQAAAATQP